ncbi:aldehyde dehydrogenase [Metabacillus iocasae]|uniref:Aldehyde dehydrogenase n=1 Tax=Priestia iocasae TaxID=2291674 RepID=A0ABS2QRW3_9BACI|nr:aldehyde dehydrogenase [Metabacillus iocasae]MBM7702189.1 aldehyde dehydrogenase (NAD+) [Metabacillus iocasae]
MNHEQYYVTDEAVIAHIVEKQKHYFHEGQTRDVKKRIEGLETLRKMVKDHEQEILEAMKTDLNKSEVEAYTTEIGVLLEEIRFTLKHIHKWVKTKKVKTALTHVGSKGYVVPEPYGVTLVIAPWNYPLNLALSPVVGALAAGNTVVLKPSELTPNVSRLLEKMLAKAFDPSLITVVEGSVETSEILLKQKFDYIFFTGSVNVGKIVMQEAAKQLIPVTLELGGKSPCIVHEDANIELAAKRIMFGKGINAGQTCVAPDYLFVHKNVKSALIDQLQKVIHEFYGEYPEQSDRYGRIVSKRHFERLRSFLQDGEIVVGGQVNEDEWKLSPTILDHVNEDAPVMQEEIFGPILPLMEYDELSEVIQFVNNRPKPLALYLFTESDEVQQQIVNNISYGGGCINDTLMHLATPYLPFGGVGESGVGQYHGESSFQTFSHYKSVLKQTTKFDMSFRYPSEKQNIAIIKKLLR